MDGMIALFDSSIVLYIKFIIKSNSEINLELL